MAQGSNWNAELYDDKHSFVWKMAAGLLDLLETKPGERILDLGCGTGHLTEQIADRGAKVVGVDKSLEMIQQARAKFPSLQFEVMDAREIAFADPFDAVFSNATLHWIKEPEKRSPGSPRLCGLKVDLWLNSAARAMLRACWRRRNGHGTNSVFPGPRQVPGITPASESTPPCSRNTV